MTVEAEQSTLGAAEKGLFKPLQIEELSKRINI